ncbi:MAG: hypothetical protein AABX14_02735 [Candidatus Aenigmatarchaeota archaeon]
MQLKKDYREFFKLFTKHMNVCRFDEKESECQICKKRGIPQ